MLDIGISYFNSRQILNDSFFNLVQNMSRFIKSSHAYQLTREPQLLKQTIKKWNKNQIHNLDKEINILKQHLEETQL